MHIVHLIAVEADDEEEAVDAAEAAISEFGNGNVWDWYTVGGRWEGYLDGENTCNAAKKPQVFTAALDGVVKSQNREWDELRNRFTGKVVTDKDVGDSSLGFPIDDKAGYAERVSAGNAKAKQAFDLMCRSKNLETWRSLAEGLGSDGFMLGYYLRKLGTMVSGDYHFESYFYDGVEYTAIVDATRTRVATDAQRQWLVVMDLHN